MPKQQCVDHPSHVARQVCSPGGVCIRTVCHTSPNHSCSVSPSKKCRPVERTEPREVCTAVPGSVCTSVPVTSCHEVTQETCHKELRRDPEEVCVNIQREQCASLPKQVRGGPILHDGPCDLVIMLSGLSPGGSAELRVPAPCPVCPGAQGGVYSGHVSQSPAPSEV